MTINDITPEQIKQVDGLLAIFLLNIGMFRISTSMILKMMVDIGGLDEEMETYSTYVAKLMDKGLSMELEDKLFFLDQHAFLINTYKEYIEINL